MKSPTQYLPETNYLIDEPHYWQLINTINTQIITDWTNENPEPTFISTQNKYYPGPFFIFNPPSYDMVAPFLQTDHAAWIQSRNNSIEFFLSRLDQRYYPAWKDWRDGQDRTGVSWIEKTVLQPLAYAGAAGVAVGAVGAIGAGGAAGAGDVVKSSAEETLFNIPPIPIPNLSDLKNLQNLLNEEKKAPHTGVETPVKTVETKEEKSSSGILAGSIALFLFLIYKLTR